MKTLPYQRVSYCLLFCLQALSQGAEIPKLFTNIALNQGTSWNASGAIPGSGDVMLWNNTFADAVAITALSPMGADFSVQGLKVTNVGGARNQASRVVGFTNATSANTLTIGTGGIDMSTALQSLYMQSKVTIGADQTWNITDANTNGNPAGFNNNEDLAFAAQVLNAPFNLNGKTVNTTGNGYITITNGYQISNGTLNAGINLFVIQGGNSTQTSIANTTNLGVNSGRLRFQSNSGALSSAALINVNNTGTLELRSNNGTQGVTQSGQVTLNAGGAVAYLLDSGGPVTLSGGLVVNGNATMRVTGTAGANANGGVFSGNLTGSATLAVQNTNTNANGVPRWTGDNSGYTGTITLNGASGNRILRLASATAGSAAATWNVNADNILQVDGLAVQIGTLNGAGFVTNSHATNPATVNIGAGVFTGAVTDGLAATAVTKVGSGTALLTGSNSYTGLTTVSQGTLMLSTDHLGTGAVTVADGATFGSQVKSSTFSISVGDVTVGNTTGGTLLLDYGAFPNPGVQNLAVGNLRFNGPSTLQVSGKNLTTGTFPLLQYTTLDPASTAVNALTLKLPTRTTGSLTDTGLGIDLTINTTEQVKWNGDVSNNWDIDPTGANVVGTPNWKTTVGGASTRYIQGTVGTDVVTFDDSAAGTGSVVLTADVSPVGITFNNSTKDYVLTGSGKITGFTSLEKNGTGSVTLANTTANDYTGGTFINAGTLKLGDGTTAGAGVIAGSITNQGTLVLNRPDNHDFTNPLTAAGNLEKAQASTVTIPTAFTLDGNLLLSGGKLRFTAGGSLNGAISGSGELESAGGTLDLAGSTANTNTGLVTVSAGNLRLTKSTEGTHAVGGDIDITGTGVVTLVANEQVPNTATIRALGTSADSLGALSTGIETFANAVVNGVATTQMILRNTATVTGTGTVNQGILGVASGHSVTINAVVMTSPTALLRVAGNTLPSTMNVGAGGITASGGDVQVKFNTGPSDATLNLAGDVTTTGNFMFSNGDPATVALNVVNLSGNRTFNIGADTTTTVAPDISNATAGETFTKSGGGTLTLNATNTTTIAGGSIVSAGSLFVNGSLASTLQVDASGTVGGSGTITGAVTVNGAVAPGAAAAIGKLTASGSVTLAPGSDLHIGVGSWTGTTAGTDWDQLAADSLAFTATAGNKLVIHITGTPTGFTETAKTIAIATSTAAVTGFDASAIEIDSAGFSGSGTWTVQLNGNTVELVYAAGTGSPYGTWATSEGLDGTNNGQGADPDQDGELNIVEFALAGEPLSGISDKRVITKIATAGGEQALTLTLAVRDTAGNPTPFSGGTEQTATVDGVTYRIQGGNDLTGWGLVVSEVTGADATAIQTGLTSLPAGWRYRTFRTPGAVTADSKEFLRAKISGTP